MSLEITLRQILRGAHARIACDAAAFVSPSRDVFEVYCKDGVDARTAREKFELTADTFLIESRNRTEAVLLNRVRFEVGGPLLGRFLIAPVLGGEGQFLGVTTLWRAAEAEPFTTEEGCVAMQASQQLAALMSSPSDSLTGLPTSAQLERLIEWRMHAAKSSTESSVLYGDIDQLHVVNDCFGFEAGDRAIAAVAAALSRELSSTDALLGRLSGDRFAMFLPGCRLQDACEIADRLRIAITQSPLSIEAESTPLSLSIGAATLGVGERSFDHAVAAAEVACKTAKDRGRNRVEAYEKCETAIVRRREDIAIVSQLRTALAQGRFQIFGQPIAPLVRPDSTRRYEMLLRIFDEKDRLVLPGRFMPAATRYQLSAQIDRCVVSQVLQQLKAARAAPNFEPLEVSLNLSGPTISEPAFHDWLLQELETSGVPGEWLTFELTETAAVQNLESAKLLMNRLGERGCRFALDDFGAGVSSLAHLKDMHFSMLKIDGMFIRDLLRNERSQALVRAIAQLARAMNMETVAEYVETPIICMRLLDLDVQYGQGHAIGRPRPLEKILDAAPVLAAAS